VHDKPNHDDDVEDDDDVCYPNALNLTKVFRVNNPHITVKLQEQFVVQLVSTARKFFLIYARLLDIGVKVHFDCLLAELLILALLKPEII